MDNTTNECKLCDNYNFDKVAVMEVLGQYEICLQSNATKETNFHYCPLCGKPIKSKVKNQKGDVNMIEREKFFAKNSFLAKKKIVLEDKSVVFKAWAEHSTVTKEEFIKSLEWLCDDTLDERGRMTREIGLTPNGIVKLQRIYGKGDMCAFYQEDGQLWPGAWFKTPCKTEKEKLFSLDGETLDFCYKICLSCKDKV